MSRCPSKPILKDIEQVLLVDFPKMLVKIKRRNSWAWSAFNI
jgi:hypothetical protein